MIDHKYQKIRRFGVGFLAIIIIVSFIVGLTGAMTVGSEKTSPIETRSMSTSHSIEIKTISSHSLSQITNDEKNYIQKDDYFSSINATEIGLPNAENLTFSKSTTKNEYSSYMGIYVEQTNNINNQTQSLRNKIEEIEDSDDKPAIIMKTEHEKLTDANLKEFQNKYEALSNVYFDLAMDTGDARAVDGLKNAKTHTETVEQRYQEALKDYEAEIANVVAMEKNSVRKRFAIVFAPTFLFGLFIGAIPPYRQYKKVSYDRQFTSVAYRWTVAKIPLLLAILSIAIAIVAAWFVGSPLAIGEIL